MKKILKYKRVYLLGLIPLSLLLTFIAKKSDYFAEHIYVKHIYKWLSQIISTITGLLPFSIAEILILILPILIFLIFIRFIFKMVSEKDKRKERVIKALLNILCTVSVIYFLFTALAGLNYYRYTFSYYSNLEIIDSTLEELYTLTERLMMDANNLRSQVPLTDEEGVFKLSVNNYKLAKAANEAYSRLAEDYPILGGYYGTPKPVVFSKAMSYAEITGIFIPFTMEANVNVDVPDYTIPATMLHELAHQRGFMREDEANFLAYLAGMKSNDVEFRYSSTMHALVVSGNALYGQNTDMYFKIRDQYSEEVLKDLRANSAYWVQYEDTVISAMSNTVNDTYLKANSQSDGVKSYGRMLDLLLAKYRKDTIID